jgi:hypothetical protein
MSCEQQNSQKQLPNLRNLEFDSGSKVDVVTLATLGGVSSESQLLGGDVRGQN